MRLSTNHNYRICWNYFTVSIESTLGFVTKHIFTVVGILITKQVQNPKWIILPFFAVNLVLSWTHKLFWTKKCVYYRRNTLVTIRSDQHNPQTVCSPKSWFLVNFTVFCGKSYARRKHSGTFPRKNMFFVLKLFCLLGDIIHTDVQTVYGAKSWNM